jgi:hypothetical protein
MATSCAPDAETATRVCALGANQKYQAIKTVNTIPERITKIWI